MTDASHIDGLPFFLFFPLFWMGICFLLSRVSGWASLAQHYAGKNPPTGNKYYMQSMGMGFSKIFMASYGNCLTIRISEHSFFLKTWWLFRLGHTPLEIPLQETSVEQGQFLFFKITKLTFKRAPNIKVHIFGGAGKHLANIT